MSSNLMRLPAELRELRQWIVWKYEGTTNGKPTKIPYRIDGNGRADVSDPSTWGDFGNALELYNDQRRLVSGIGFVFSEHDEYCGIDLDATQNPEHLEAQRRVFEKFNSYSERSPSGSGLHIICKAKLISGRRRNSIELYSSNRFFTMTGDVYHDRPIEARQELADILWQELGKIKTVSGYQGTYEEKETDTQILYRASRAINGEKFAALLNGKWRDYYPSQSEADFAFVDMVAFYTQNRNQIARLFRQSSLGAREKASRSDYVEYMLDRAFDRMLPPVDIEGLSNALDEHIARKKLQDAQRFNDPVPIVPEGDALENPYSPPPGLLGEIAAFIYAAAPRPVPEIALAGAIALLAGVAGRAYNVGTLALNQYILLLANTGAGKEAMASGIDQLMASIKNDVPAAKDFVGPAEIASGQGLLKRLATTPCIFTILGEFGLRFQQFASPRASSVEIGLKRMLMDLYHKSGAGREWNGAAYSNKENNVASVTAPSLTILGESTPETFYRVIDETIVSDGLLPRFMVIEYNGDRQSTNVQHEAAFVPETLRTKFADLAAHCLKLAHGTNGVPITIKIAMNDEVRARAIAFDKKCDDEINGATREAIRHLWNRAHVKVMKLAGLVAVGVNPYNPTLELSHLEWAIKIVTYDVKRLHARFARGDIGAETDETRQMSEIQRMMHEYATRPFSDLYAYNIPEIMHRDKVIPMGYLSRRLLHLASFKNDRFGSTNALKRAVTALMENGCIREIGRTELLDKYGSAARSFVVCDMVWLMETARK